MARNANFDKAKRQAVGIYRKASPNAMVNHGMELYSGGEYRRTDATKDWYRAGSEPLSREAIESFIALKGVRVCRPCLNSSGRIVVPNDLNRKRAGCDPQQRGELVPGKAERVAAVLKGVM